MNSEDKILLMSYVDGELDAKQNLEAEKLIGENNLAMSFVNQLKIANNSIEASYQGENFNELNSRIDAFIEENFKEEKVSIVSLISSFFSSRQTLNYSLTALFFLSVGVFYDDFIPSDQNMKLNLNDSLYEKQVFKKRGIEENTKIKDLLSTTIGEMINEKSSKAKLLYGSDSYMIFVEGLNSVNEKLDCYDGTIYKDGVPKNFSYCIAQNDNTFIYTD